MKHRDQKCRVFEEKVDLSRFHTFAVFGLVINEWEKVIEFPSKLCSQ